MQTILLAIRSTEHLIVLADLLTSKGYCVIPGMDGAFALSVLRQGTPVDAVIADYDLADGGATALIRSIRTTVPAPPPVIFVSDRVDVNDYLTSLSDGAFDVFFRPVPEREFLRALRIALEARSSGEHNDGSGVHPAVAADQVRRTSPAVFYR